MSAVNAGTRAEDVHRGISWASLTVRPFSSTVKSSTKHIAPHELRLHPFLLHVLAAMHLQQGPHLRPLLPPPLSLKLIVRLAQSSATSVSSAWLRSCRKTRIVLTR